jgi:hypothetical protein
MIGEMERWRRREWVRGRKGEWVRGRYILSGTLCKTQWNSVFNKVEKQK